MAVRGFPVTVDESLAEAFAGHEKQIHWLIDSCGIAEAPQSLERLWGPDCGYFYAASINPQAILDSWIRLGIIDGKGSLLLLIARRTAMSEVVAESVQTQSDGTLWAITVQTVDAGDFGFEVESQVKDPDSISWRSLDVVGPYKRLVEAIEEAERLYRGHKLLLV